MCLVWFVGALVLVALFLFSVCMLGSIDSKRSLRLVASRRDAQAQMICALRKIERARQLMAAFGHKVNF